MAQRTVVVLEDDLNGGEASETVSFALDGVSYEIDLDANNAAALRDALATYVGVARKTGRSGRGSGRARGRSGHGGPSADLGAIRTWARANGHTVSDRGRVSATIQDAYEAAH